MSGGLMSCGLMSCGLKFGGLMSGGLKSHDLPIYPLCGIFHFPEIEGTNGLQYNT